MKLEAKQRLQIDAATSTQAVSFLTKFFKQRMGKFKPIVEGVSGAKTDDAGTMTIKFSVFDTDAELEIDLGQPQRGSENLTWTALYLQLDFTLPIEYDIGRNILPAHSRNGTELQPYVADELIKAGKFWTAYAEFAASLGAALKELQKVAKKNDPKEEPDF